MTILLSEIHFWTTQDDIIIKHIDYGSFKYYLKKDCQDSLYGQSKKLYCEQRNIIWTPINKRPTKLKDRLKELEEYLIHNKIVSYNWDDDKLQLLLSTGLLVNILINNQTGDLSSILFDKQLSAKLQVNIICDGTIFGPQVICICNDGHVLGFGGQWRDGWVLEGGPRRRLNYYGEWLAVWGKAGAEHPQPWSPMAKDHQRANLHLYWIGARGPELLAYKKTDGEPLQIIVSKTCNRTLILVEQKVTQRGTVSVEVSNFELVGNNLKRVSVTSVPLQTQVSCSALSQYEDKLLIGCIDGSLALLDRNRGSTRSVKAAFIPTFTVWHPGSAVVAISNERGQLQYFDTALNCIKSQIQDDDCTSTSIIDLSTYFNIQFNVVSIDWGPKDLLFSFEQGPILVVTHVEGSLTFKSVAQRYLALGKIDKAIKLLLSWDFNEDSFFVLQRITALLMRRAMTEEIAQHLQNTLGCFHNSPVPLPTVIHNRYGNQVYSLTRRFFHQLVRAGMYETAFLLAVDLGHHDLFMDLHYIAVKIGETEMAAAARAQASALLSRCSSEASNCSRSSCSQCSDSGSSTSEEFSKNTPPISLNNDNFLTTNFNNPDPTTYKPELSVPPPPPTIIDFSKFNYPRATYVKSPQVPSNFTKFSAPPLPFAPVLPSNNNNNSSFVPNFTSSKPPNFFPPPKFTTTNMSCALSSSSIGINNLKSSFTPINKQILPPPLPIAPPLIAPPPAPSVVTTGGVKKQQAKVKFSDTVTAFIVPEIKRPVRPPPPPHVTDPQKELADSLPLCHPNEDYLKDFTPVRKGEEKASGQPQQQQQPKIKVVHFGVV